MLHRRTIAKNLLIILLLSLLFKSHEKYNSFINEAVKYVNLTSAQARLLMTSNFAYETKTIVSLWDKCVGYNGHASADECLGVIGSAVGKWSFEILFWRKVAQQLDSERVDLQIVYIDLGTSDYTNVNVDSKYIELRFDGGKYKYELVMHDDLLNGTSTLILLVSENPFMLEMNENGTLALGPLLVKGNSKVTDKFIVDLESKNTMQSNICHLNIGSECFTYLLDVYQHNFDVYQHNFG